MAKNTGKAFEKFVESIYQKMIKQHEKIDKDVWMDGPDKKRQIDLLITGEIAGYSLKTIIECRDYNTKLSIGHIDAFESKMKDVRSNVGIMVTTKGFSSKAISKAKRLGISLLTAHEILNDKWEFENNIQILFREISPSNLQAQYHGVRPHEGTITADFRINDVNIFHLVRKKWAADTLKYSLTERLQDIRLEELKKPYWIISNKQPQTISDYGIQLKLTIRYYKSTLKELKGTQILKDYINNKLNIFIPTDSIINQQKKLIPIKPKDAKDFTGLTINIKINDAFPEKYFFDVEKMN